MMDDDSETEPPLLLRFSGEGGTVPAAPVHLDCVGSTQIVPGILRPDVPITHMASQWADALDLSTGAAVLAQLATRDDELAAHWGPCEMITPVIDPEMSVGRDLLGGLLLGQDFLESVWVTYIGPAGLIAITRSPSE